MAHHSSNAPNYYYSNLDWNGTINLASIWQKLANGACVLFGMTVVVAVVLELVVVLVVDGCGKGRKKMVVQ